MAVRTTKVTRKGQITIPIDFREKYNFKEGDIVLVEDRDGRLTIQHPDQSVDWTAGYLRQFTNGEFLTPEEMREIAAQAMADEVMAEMEEIESCRER